MQWHKYKKALFSIRNLYFKFSNVFISSTYLQIKFDNKAAKKSFIQFVKLIYDLLLSSVDRNFE